jgi:predicted outer membrane protein
MDSGFTKTIGLAILTAVLATFAALADNGAAANEAAGTVALADTAHHDSIATPRWLSDGSILSLLGVIDARQVALADAELQAWHSDTVRAFAADLARGHAELQHTVDSLAAAARLTPVVPALQDSLIAALQPHLDTVNASHGPQMDRVFVQQAINTGQFLSDYLAQLTAVAATPEVQALVDDAGQRVASELARGKQIQAMFVVADSIVADSLAKRAAARHSRNGPGTNR